MSEWSKKRRVMRHYNRIARIYDRQYAEEQMAKINAILSHVSLNGESFILDVGCGTGIIFPIIAKARLAIGVDTSSKLLQKAKQYTKEILNTHIICADSDYMPFKNNVFNIVFAITLLQNMPNPLTTLEEIKRTSGSKAIIAVTALKKEFSKQKFTKLLKDAQLKILTLKTDEKLRDHIAICQTQ
jgi:ubiquinone/menaquinone biosynthesis C-methylase UbiE